ncbi:LTA synthase family protein [Haliea sp. E1-2-M8]|uniref:LTA synthase family protein n=1 Tax=Haliea sp. E1-2-M8 TaxID=3064706 RepID=UPI00271C9185|nr:LTA synthase family protein [Haliea sp. E1-2-M8]MDO8861973.1 LTA synthase family protein [Haliea sp. E1-2-M8]
MLLPSAPPAIRMLLNAFLLGLLLLLTARLGLVLWHLDRVSASGLLPQVFLHGLRADSIMMSLLLLPPALLLPLAWWRRSWPLWRLLAAAWLALCLLLLVFMEASTPAFLGQYEARPNRLFFEYLAWPGETLRMLWGGFRLQLLASSGLIALAALVAALWLRRTVVELPFQKPAWHTVAAWPLLLLALVMGVRSTLDHRPLNPSWFAFASDNLVNQLMLNSTWSLAHAVYNLRHESHAGERYGKMTEAEILQTVKTTAADYGITDFADHTGLPTLRHQSSTRTDERHLNLVIILEESLGATYVGALGGIEGLTPNLQRLGEQGWWFENLYATGTRSVRGIEAVTTGFLPTPARAVVKLLGSRGGFFTLAALLGREGYHSEFIYGGEGHFDNMAGFFLANGFDQVIDERDYESPVFEGSWGVSDEDLFAKTDERLQQHHATGQPSFSLVFTSSNHTPFDYPEGRIELYEEPAATENNAIRYADYALGQFFARARSRDYWQDTVFVVVADHDNQVVGDNLVPVERFHIPGLILGADIDPRRIKTVASQIDLPTTALSLIGISANHPMLGRDFSTVGDQEDGRAMMQFGDRFVWMENSRLVILAPEQAPVFAHYDSAKKQVTPVAGLPPEAHRRALAHALLPSWLYRSGGYSLEPVPVAAPKQVDAG